VIQSLALPGKKVCGVLLQQLWKIDIQDLLANSSDYVAWCHTVSCPTASEFAWGFWPIWQWSDVPSERKIGCWHEPSKASTNSSKKCDSSTQLQQIHGSWVIIVWSAVDQEIHGTKQAKQSHWLSASPVCPTGLLYTQQLLAQIFQPRVAGSILSFMSYVNTMVSFRRKFPCEKWCLGSHLCHLRGIIHALKSSQHPSTIPYWTALGHHRCWKKSCTTYRMYKTLYMLGYVKLRHYS